MDLFIRFNPDLLLLNNSAEYLKHVYDKCIDINKKYFTDYKGIHFCSYCVRTFTSFSQFSTHYKTTEKMFYVYDTDTFYMFYKNFDIVFYKEKYFKNVDVKDIDILSHSWNKTCS
jgi:hypothetical protein